MLSIGIVGLPNVGKSTLFNALTKNSVPAENYPFCTIDPSVGIVAVPDERLNELSRLSGSKKTIPAAIEFVDIAGLVGGAHKGEGLGNKFLANIREVDAIAQVVRIFEDKNITHVHNKIDPLDDIGVINLELIMADFQTVTKIIANLFKDVKKGNKEAIFETNILKKFEKILDEGELISSLELSEEEIKVAKLSNLLTSKKFLYVLNKKAGQENLDETKDEKWEKLINFMKESNSGYVIVDAGIECELNAFDGKEKEEFREEMNVCDDGINNLIRKSYEILDLITFLTTGEDETRAWTIKKNSSAPIAGMAIHTDFKEKFIRADVIEYKKLLEMGSYTEARSKGLVRTEGKEYIVQDGDVIEFKI